LRFTGCDRDLPFSEQDFKKTIDGITNKMKLYKMNSLESFSINFISSERVSDKSLRYLKQNLMTHSPGLKRLALNFYSASSSNRGFEAVSDLILSFKSLESLQMRFFASSCAQDKYLASLIKKIKKSHRFIKNLQIDVSTKFERHYDDMQFLKRDSFQELTWWDHTGITTDSQGVSKNCALNMSLAIINNFEELQSLNLMLNSMHGITDKICLRLGKGILEKMICLKSLNLDFSDCQQITNNGLSLFNKTPNLKRKLRTLEHLALKFSNL